MNFFLLPPIDKTTGITTHERSRQGETNDWLTPMHVIHALGPFDLDVAASEAEPYRCADRAFTATIECVGDGRAVMAATFR